MKSVVYAVRVCTDKSLGNIVKRLWRRLQEYEVRKVLYIKGLGFIMLRKSSLLTTLFSDSQSLDMKLRKVNDINVLHGQLVG